MRKGKIAAQAAHASVLSVLGMQVDKSRHDVFKDWLSTGMPKICVSVDSEAELDFIVKSCRENNIPCVLVTDEGRTEFNGIKTKTCCAVGPADSEEVDKITGHLILL